MSILEQIKRNGKYVVQYSNNANGDITEDPFSEEWFYELTPKEQDFILNEAVNINIEVYCEGELQMVCNLAENLYEQQFFVGVDFGDEFEGHIPPYYYTLKDTGYFKEYNGLAGIWEFKVVD